MREKRFSTMAMSGCIAWTGARVKGGRGAT
jgi:hypothetical protein